MVRYAASQIEALCPQVINAARILAARPRSRVAQDNMDTFRDAWENQVRVSLIDIEDCLLLMYNIKFSLHRECNS